MLVFILGMMFVFTAYRLYQASGAYRVAKASLEGDPQVAASLGDYALAYDWWEGAFRIATGDISRFEFHLDGDRDDAIAYVEVSRGADWRTDCVRVINGQYLNQKIVDTCAGD